MLNDLRQILSRSPVALLEDTLGVVAIAVAFVVVLHFPVM